ncbi:MAG TPA: glycosyltransferase family 39 protein [Terracidiphilus sp.]|nr:glycosyltransferase family 39 protein [Terracidiphilus sp.]
MEPAQASQFTGPRAQHRKHLLGVGGTISIAAALAAGLALRAWMMEAFPQPSGDPQIYADLAKNLLRHGQFATTGGNGMLHPTLIRLPGYPLFMAVCFSFLGMDNLSAIGWLQIALELAGYLLLADFVRRIASSGAAHCTLWLAALCPFTAIYAGAPLTEAPTVFLIAWALWLVQRFQEQPEWKHALLFTAAVTFAALLRPDGALVAVALAPAMLWGTVVVPPFPQKTRKRDGQPGEAREGTGFRPSVWEGTAFRPYIKDTEKDRALAPEAVPPQNPIRIPRVKLARMALACALLALAPFAYWTWRNWQVYHVFEPLAPRYAQDPGEDVDPGWQRWVKTWCLDFVSTYEIYWNEPGDKLDIHDLPSRAFDSPAQYAQTAALFQAYEANGEELSADLDARFGRLAAQRIADHPLRYYVWLPLGRLADMWLRPRVENLPIDLDWWVYRHHYAETRFSWFYAALNAVYLLLGIAGLCLRPRFWKWMLLYFVLRSALLATIEAPEARYTIECFPILFALGGIALYRLTNWVFLSVLKVKPSFGIG